MNYALLPDTEQKALRREYRLRVMITACFLLAGACIIGVGALFPTYIRAVNDERAALDDLAAIKKTAAQNGTAQIAKDLAVDAARLAVLAQGVDAPPLSAALAAVIRFKGAVRLTTLDAERVATTTLIITVQGLAPTRANLIDFRDRLQALTKGAEVDLPISALAKESNIQFSIQINQPLKP